MEDRERSFSSVGPMQNAEQLRTSERPAAEITVVGAGMSGLLMAIYLHRRGYSVDIYERRPDMRRSLSRNNAPST